MKNTKKLNTKEKIFAYLVTTSIFIILLLAGCRSPVKSKTFAADTPLFIDPTTNLVEGESPVIEHLSWTGMKRTATLTPELKWHIYEYNNNGQIINHFLHDTLSYISSDGENLKINNQITGYGILFYFFDPPDYKKWQTSNHIITFLSWDRIKWEATLKRRDPYVYRVNVPDYPFLLKKLK